VSIEEKKKVLEENVKKEGKQQLKIEDKNSKENIQKSEQNTEKLKEIENEYSELKERYNELENYARRLKAEFENYKQLVAKEKQQIIKSATEYMIEKLIPIVDDFERALKNLNLDDLNKLKNFAKGVEMIYKSLIRLLENEGVKVIESNGKKFDPFEHEAVEKIETDEFDEYTVIEEIEKGYKIHSKVIKPAKVKVAIKPMKKSEGGTEN